MTIEEYHMICKKIDKEGKVELEVVDEDENRKRMFATEYVAIQKNSYLKIRMLPGFTIKTPLSFKD